MFLVFSWAQDLHWLPCSGMAWRLRGSHNLGWCARCGRRLKGRPPGFCAGCRMERRSLHVETTSPGALWQMASSAHPAGLVSVEFSADAMGRYGLRAIEGGRAAASSGISGSSEPMLELLGFRRNCCGMRMASRQQANCCGMRIASRLCQRRNCCGMRVASRQRCIHRSIGGLGQDGIGVSHGSARCQVSAMLLWVCDDNQTCPGSVVVSRLRVFRSQEISGGAWPWVCCRESL